MARGKLYICGEYAVVDGSAAIISAVNREITAHLIPGHDGEELCTSVGFPHLDKNHELRYSQAASYIALQYICEEGDSIPTDTSLVFQSNLRDHTGRKYGLGSSGAVTIAVLHAILKDYKLTALDMYKLAVICLLGVGDNGSFGDVACSAFGQLIYYVKPSRVFLEDIKSSFQTMNLHNLIDMEWDGLSIVPLHWPDKIEKIVGWTGTPASSTELVHAVSVYKKDCAESYAQFVAQSNALSEKICHACEENDSEAFLKTYAQASELVSNFSQDSGGFAETQELKTLKQVAQNYGFSAKFSGAGGGDCGIALSSTSEYSEQLRHAWELSGIIAMNWELL